MKLDPDYVNGRRRRDALGRPLGCSAARLVTLLGRLERDYGFLGLAMLCVGVGQGVRLPWNAKEQACRRSTPPYRGVGEVFSQHRSLAR